MTVERRGFPGAERQTEISPARELLTFDGKYRWFVYDFATGVKDLCLEDLKTGLVVVTPLVSDTTRVAAHKAWKGARQSRAPGTPWEITYEMQQKGVDPDQKQDEMFSSYGHRSVGDMARQQLEYAYLPMHLCWALFNDLSINGGQEKSTRYQKKFQEAALHLLANYLPEGLDQEIVNGLERKYQQLGQLSLEFFGQHRNILTALFTEYYQPRSGKEKSALDSRVLDCARYFLLFGMYSGLAIETSARDWSRVIGEFRASPVPFYRSAAQQMQYLLTPSLEEEAFLQVKAESPSLIRHTEPATQVNENLGALKEHLEGKTDLLTRLKVNSDFKGYQPQSVELLEDKFTEAERMVAQYILTLYPGIDRQAVLVWLHTVPMINQKQDISRIIFNGHDCYDELSVVLSRTTRMTEVFETYLGEGRDWNRHRSMGRFMTLPAVFGQRWDKSIAEQILGKGFGLPLYLTEVNTPEFRKERETMSSDMTRLFSLIYSFVSDVDKMLGKDIDHSYLLNLLPLSQRVDLWMHMDPKSAGYTFDRRVRPGGHINYRDTSYSGNQLLVNSDPYLEGMRLSRKPDPSSREEFFDRS